MKSKDVKKLIKTQLENNTPDVLDKILSKCEGEKQYKEEKKSFKIFSVLSYALVTILVFFGVLIFNTSQNKVFSTILLDVNPSIEIKANKLKIVDVKALNNDGKTILKGMDLKNTDLETGINAIIGSMYKNGFISESKNSILVTVSDKNETYAKELESIVTNKIDGYLSSINISSSIISQESKNDSEVNKKAEDYGVSSGKALFINKILDSNLKDKNGVSYTFDELVNLNINELKLLLESKNQTVSNTTSKGSASSKSYISKDKAKSIALNNAKVKESNITDYGIELDYEYGQMIYEIEFDALGKEYDYDINAITGQIINKEVKVDEDYKQPSNKSSSTNSNKSSSSSTTKKSTTTKTQTYISRAKAKAIAFSNAGVKEKNVRDLSIEFEKENGKYIYEVDFEVGKKEYNYDIDAISGKIIKKDVEIDD